MGIDAALANNREIRNIMTTANKPAAKAMATAIAAALCTYLAYAATPTAVWDCEVSGQELNTTQGGLTIEPGHGNTSSNGKIAIAEVLERMIAGKCLNIDN